VDYTRYLADVLDFPKPGIVFKDISPLLADPNALECATVEMENAVMEMCPRPKGVSSKSLKIVALDARGFLFGTPVAMGTLRGLVMARKPGKLPGKTVTVDYGLEYGTNTLAMQHGSIQEGDRVVIVDDILATGGTLLAAAQLVEMMGGTVMGMVCFLEIEDLEGRKLIEEKGYEIRTLVTA
jgi:adenine phosphoribosyltransferase